MTFLTPWVFRLFAGFYDALTAQETWQRHCREMGRRLGGRRVLDLGIGPGVSGLELLREAPSRSLVGVDLSPEMLRRARRHAAERSVELPLVRADALHLPFRDGAYDGATGHSFLYLLPDGDAVLREVHRVVRPGGSIVFLEPNALGLRERARSVVRSYAGGVRFGTSMLLWGIFSAMHGRYTPESLTRQLARCGFRTTDVAVAFGGLGLVATATRS